MTRAKCLASIVFGAVLGSATTWFFTKKYYARIAQEEIDSVKDVFSKRAADISNVEPVEEQTVEECDEVIKEYEYSTEVEVPMGSPEILYDEPYVIEPDEFGTMFDYDQIELTYFADGVLTDSWNYPIDNPIELVGEDFSEHFGENKDEPDAVYIRNDQKKAEYVIYTDERNSTEVIKYGENEVEME